MPKQKKIKKVVKKIVKKILKKDKAKAKAKVITKKLTTQGNNKSTEDKIQIKKIKKQATEKKFMILKTMWFTQSME